MISRRWSWKHASRTSVVVAASALAIGVAACGGSNDASGTKTVTVVQSTSAGSQNTPAGSQNTPAGNKTAPVETQTVPAGESSATGAVADYQPASVLSKTASSTVLTSPDSVSKIGSYY